MKICVWLAPRMCVKGDSPPPAVKPVLLPPPPLLFICCPLIPDTQIPKLLSFRLISHLTQETPSHCDFFFPKMYFTSLPSFLSTQYHQYHPFQAFKSPNYVRSLPIYPHPTHPNGHLTNLPKILL